MLKMLSRTIRRWATGLPLAAIALAAASAAETPPLQTLDRIAAIVNDDVITTSELEQRLTTLEKQLRQQRTPMPPRNVLRKQVLERMVLNRIQLQLAAATGKRVDDEATVAE
ncbi:MAG: SurA N-terminal domain-containing protein, partial [Gammaproteobacteria bacterium]